MGSLCRSLSWETLNRTQGGVAGVSWENSLQHPGLVRKAGETTQCPQLQGLPNIRKEIFPKTSGSKYLEGTEMYPGLRLQ